MKKSIITMALAASALAFTSCDEDLGNLLADPKVAEAFLDMETIYLDAFVRVDEAMKNADVIANGSATIDQAAVTLDGSALTIDFGATPKLCKDGRTRSGKIEATVNGDYRAGTGSNSMNFVDYKVEDKTVAGTLSATNKGNNNGQPTFDLGLANGNHNEEYTLSFVQEMIWTAGFDTEVATDDAFTLSASQGAGSSIKDNQTFTFNIPAATPLSFDGTCAQKIETGVVNLSAKDSEDKETTYEVDFLEECGNTVKVTVNGVTVITVPFKGF